MPKSCQLMFLRSLILDRYNQKNLKQPHSSLGRKDVILQIVENQQHRTHGVSSLYFVIEVCFESKYNNGNVW